MINKHRSSIKKFQVNLKLVEEHLSKGNHEEAVKYLLVAEGMEPRNFAILNEIGTCYSKLGDNNKALIYHLKAQSISKDNPIILCNVGIDLQKLNRHQESIDYLKKSILIDPNNYMPYSGIASNYHSLGDYVKLSKISIEALALFPSISDFHVNLATALIGLNQYEQAAYCIETALLLNPNSIDAKFNLARILSLKNLSSDAINAYEELLNSVVKFNHDLVPFIKYNLSFEYLKMGYLEKGWEYFESGFDSKIPLNKGRQPNRRFKVPLWLGEEGSQKSLLVWAEQGIGDEILFMSLLKDLSTKLIQVIVECDKRLVSIVKRSYPNFIVRSPHFDVNKDQLLFDYDYHIPMGSLPRLFRKKISDFHPLRSYLVPSKISNLELDSFFKENSKFLKIGICWRSGLLTNEREINYIPLSQWEKIFSIPNAVFINLQYGECEEELNEAEEFFNKKIHRWPFIDLKNDLENTFMLIEQLDLVITADTAVSPIAFSIGKPALTFMNEQGWANLGEKLYPWSSNMISFTPKKDDPLQNVLLDISEYIRTNYPKIFFNN